eukprot:COSAG01_NODE_70245_length_259_cov_0.643750_1_plen_61_part_10
MFPAASNLHAENTEATVDELTAAMPTLVVLQFAWQTNLNYLYTAVHVLNVPYGCTVGLELL